jgi:hypothetical protein
MRYTAIALFISLVCWKTAVSCSNSMDGHACGIVWNNGEILKFDTIQKIGKQDSNFIKDTGNSYVFRSHVYSNAMVILGPTFMNILFDTTIDKNSFDPANAMAGELEWLAQAGIVSTTQSKRDSIADEIKLKGGYDARYYTKQKQAATFNDICFEKRLNGEQCINPPGGCGLDVLFRLPAGTLQLSATGIVHKKDSFFSANKTNSQKAMGRVFDLKGNALPRDFREKTGGPYSQRIAHGVYFALEPKTKSVQKILY